MKLLSHRNLLLYPAKTKTNNYIKIIKVIIKIIKYIYILSYLITTKIDTKKVKFNNRTKRRHLWSQKLFSNTIDKIYFKNFL